MFSFSRSLLAGLAICSLIAPQITLGAVSSSSSSARASITANRAQARSALRKTASAKTRTSSSAKSSSSSAKSNDGLVDIGVTLQKNYLAVFITAIAKGSPAETAGLKIGDEIHKIGTKEITRTSNMDTINQLLRGIPGSRVTIEYGRAQVGIKSVEVIRKWKTVSVSSKVEMHGKTLVITPEDLSEAGVESIRTRILALNTSPSSVLLDLRSYPTGSLEGVANFVGLFVPKNTILAWVETKNAPPFVVGMEKLQTTTDPLFTKETTISVLAQERTFAVMHMIIETLDRSSSNFALYGSTAELVGRAQMPSWTFKAPDNTAVEFPPVTLWRPTEEREPYLCKDNLARNACFSRIDMTMVSKLLTSGDSKKDLEEVLGILK